MKKAPRVVKVKSHVRDGKRVNAYKRTLPDSIEENNYSFKGK